MRRPALALALLIGGIGVAAQSASTASSTLPASTAVYRSTTVTGGTMTSLNYTVTAGTITAITPRLRSTTLLGSTVRARFGSDTPVICTAGLLTVLNVVTGLREGSYTCAGFLESADRPRPLTITVG